MLSLPCRMEAVDGISAILELLKNGASEDEVFCFTKLLTDVYACFNDSGVISIDFPGWEKYRLYDMKVYFHVKKICVSDGAGGWGDYSRWISWETPVTLVGK